jgi:hypothetical protein
LQKVFHELPTLYNEIDIKTQFRKYYIKKHNSLVLLDKIDESSKRNERKITSKKIIKKICIASKFFRSFIQNEIIRF